MLQNNINAQRLSYSIYATINIDFKNCVLKKLSLLEFEICGHDIIDEIVEVGSIDEPLSLVARVHGSPAELVITSLSLHEAPHRTTHHRNRLLVWHDQDLSHFVHLNALTEELTYAE